jgi:pimeloyl-ACP methyl ester carboxylesterase
MSLETSPEVVLATLDSPGMERVHCMAHRLRETGAALQPLARQVRCPVLVIAGALAAIAPAQWARALARDTDGELVLIENAGHHPAARKPVRFNLELRRFIERVSADDLVRSR